jgi:chromosome segregation ATPase
MRDDSKPLAGSSVVNASNKPAIQSVRGAAAVSSAGAPSSGDIYSRSPSASVGGGYSIINTKFTELLTKYAEAQLEIATLKNDIEKERKKMEESNAIITNLQAVRDKQDLLMSRQAGELRVVKRHREHIHEELSTITKKYNLMEAEYIDYKTKLTEVTEKAQNLSIVQSTQGGIIVRMKLERVELKNRIAELQKDKKRLAEDLDNSNSAYRQLEIENTSLDKSFKLLQRSKRDVEIEWEEEKGGFDHFKQRALLHIEELEGEVSRLHQNIQKQQQAYDAGVRLCRQVHERT